ncbi:hypothetical protein BH11ACT6_BH11ACT6_40170 [soil metagenome]
MNEPALLELTAILNNRVGAALRRGLFPVVYGGDCTTLLGGSRRSPDSAAGGRNRAPC